MTYPLLTLPKCIIKGAHKGNVFSKRLYIFVVNLYIPHPLLRQKKIPEFLSYKIGATDISQSNFAKY